jgi:uncharacterized protein YlxW (UPF0749 family)
MPESPPPERFVPSAPQGGIPRLWKALKARPDRGQVVVAVLLAALGFGVVLQVRVDTEDQLDQARRTELVQILSDLNQRSSRLESEIEELEATRRELASGADTEQVALEQTASRARQLAVLAGTAPAQGPGIVVTLEDPDERVRAANVLATVQELRVAGAEAMQIEGGNGEAVRISASSFFLDAGGALEVDGVELTRPYVIKAIGAPSALAGSIRFVSTEVSEEAVVEELDSLVVDALREPVTPEYARPATED